MDGKALSSAGAPKQNAAAESLGTLGRMQALMVTKRVRPDAARAVMEPMRNIRAARQGPAHALRANVTDRTYIHRQVALLEDVNEWLSSIRGWLSTHPENRDLDLPHSDESLGKWYRM